MLEFILELEEDWWERVGFFAWRGRSEDAVDGEGVGSGVLVVQSGRSRGCFWVSVRNEVKRDTPSTGFQDNNVPDHSSTLESLSGGVQKVSGVPDSQVACLRYSPL